MKNLVSYPFAEGRFEVETRQAKSLPILLDNLSFDHIFELHLFVENAFEKRLATNIVRNAGYKGALSVLIQPPITSKCAMLVLFFYGATLNYPVHGVSVLKLLSGELFRVGMFDYKSDAISWSDAFSKLNEKICSVSFSFSNVIKTWSYLDCDRSGSMASESFKSFNRTRSSVFKETSFRITSRENKNGYPANTGIGNLGVAYPEITGLGFLSNAKNVIVNSLENPSQLSAIKYGSKEGRNEPALFSRAVSLRCDSIELVAIAGTAAVVDSNTSNVGDVCGQLRTTIDLIRKLLSTTSDKNIEDLAYAVVYLQNAVDGDLILPILHDELGSVQTILVRAPLTREDLLIEIDCLLFGPLYSNPI
jgi:hypothetical protein